MASQQAAQTEAPLTFRTPIRDPFTIVKLFAYGLTSATALHATVFPEYRDFDFNLCLYYLTAFIVYSACHIGWLWWLRLFPQRRTYPGRPSGPATPPEGAPVPVPVRPQPPLLHKAEAKELPRTAEAASRISCVDLRDSGNS